MSSSPVCVRCHDEVHRGPVLCGECSDAVASGAVPPPGVLATPGEQAPDTAVRSSPMTDGEKRTEFLRDTDQRYGGMLRRFSVDDAAWVRFAAVLGASLLADHTHDPVTPNELAHDAAVHADAMMAERAKRIAGEKQDG